MQPSSWKARSSAVPATFGELRDLLLANRAFTPIDKLEYSHESLDGVVTALVEALRGGKRLALYADYDVDGTMSCVSWIWFLEAIGYTNFTYYIPCRLTEGYGVNLSAMAHLIDQEGADVIITMDTGITANKEAAYCRDRGVTFICTDHHVIQKEKLPDALLLNPKFHPDPAYQQLCGCGITYVLLRKLGAQFSLGKELWQDLLALAGMATICDIVPLNSVNHKLARLGVEALSRSRRTVLCELLMACATGDNVDEGDVGYRLGPRINAVGRLEHARHVVEAFRHNDPRQLIAFMTECNDRRKHLQEGIVREAHRQAEESLAPILFLGGEWHPGVVGIAASKVVEKFFRPTWLFHRGETHCKGSARAIAGFDVTAVMAQAGDLFVNFGGHAAAGGFTFLRSCEEPLRRRLCAIAEEQQSQQPQLWQRQLMYDCALPPQLLNVGLLSVLDSLRPFGHGFEAPLFLVSGHISSIKFYCDKVTQEPKHTACFLTDAGGAIQKILFFGAVLNTLEPFQKLSCLVTAGRNNYRGRVYLSLYGQDWVAG